MKKLLTFALALCCAPVALAQSYGRYQTCSLQTAQGQAVAGAQVYFLTQPANTGNLTPLATVYSNSAGTGGPVINPVTTNGFGECTAYLSPGVYTVVYKSPYTGQLNYPDQNIAIGGGTPSTPLFSGIGTGNNTQAAMGVGSGATLFPLGTGTVQANILGPAGTPVIVTGPAPAIGQALVATSSTAASWQDQSGGGGGTPAGASFALQYNNAGSFGAALFAGLVKNNGSASSPAAAVPLDVATLLQDAINCTTANTVFSPFSDTCLLVLAPLAATTPVQNAVPNWNVGTNRYEISPLTLDQIGPAFAFTSSTCSTCATVEIGTTIASPTNFTATYTSAATIGTVSDGTNTSPMSPPNSTSQSGSLAHSYTMTTAGTQTFTLTAVAATTKTAALAINWVPRSFGGTGTGASATSATASSNNAVLVGATGTLTISYLGTSCTGQVYNVTTSGTQYVYLLLPCNVSNPTAGSFTTPGPTVFPMNTPTTITFTNQFSAAVTMYLYRSTNSFFTGSNSIITVGN